MILSNLFGTFKVMIMVFNRERWNQKTPITFRPLVWYLGSDSVEKIPHSSMADPPTKLSRNYDYTTIKTAKP